MPAQKLDQTPANVNTAGPADTLFPIVPSDAADIAYVTTAIYVGGAGDVAVQDRATGSTVIFKAVPAGALLPIRVGRVLNTGTTATALVGLA